MTDLTWFDEKMHKFSYILTSPWPSARQADVQSYLVGEHSVLPRNAKFNVYWAHTVRPYDIDWK